MMTSLRMMIAPPKIEEMKMRTSVLLSLLSLMLMPSLLSHECQNVTGRC